MSATYLFSKRSIDPSQVLTFMVAIGFAVYLRTFYTGGDIFSYRRSYEAIGNLPVASAYELYGLILGANEPIYFFFSYVFSKLHISYDAFKIVLIVSIACSTARYLAWYGVSLLSRLVFIITNFYLLAVYTEAERLGLAFLFLIWALLAAQKGKSGWTTALIAMSVLSHFQMVLPIIAVGIGRSGANLLSKKHGTLRIHRKAFNWAVLAVATILLVAASTNILSGILARSGDKFAFYNERLSGIASLRQAALLFPVLVLLSRNSITDSLTYLTIAVPAVAIGEERINILLVMFYFTVVLRERRWGHPLNMLLLTYFSIKGVLFIANAMQYGRGY